MGPEFVSDLFFQALRVGMMVAAPLLLTGLAAGLIVAIFQAATQINEMTLVFIPKMLAVGIALLVFFPWMVRTLMDFTLGLYGNMPGFIR